MANTATSKLPPTSRPPSTVPAPQDNHGPKKSKAKKATDPVNTTKQIEDTIAALERNRAGEKDQELEIEREVKRANRDLSHLLSTMDQPMSRLEVVQRKYTDLLADMKRLERDHQKSKKRADQLQKEKDQSRSELGKINALKDKLEKLCRELQKENKKLKEDNKLLSETETRMREELHQRLEGMVDEVQTFIDQTDNPESSPANLELDELFRQKFKSFIDQYELRELQFHSLLKTKDIEIQYHLNRFEQQRRAHDVETSKSRQLTTQVSTFSQTEIELRNQLNIYVEKFKQVEDTLNNSNDLFLTFRREMEEMSKKTKRLEKENHTLTRKHDLTSQNILQMAEERQKASKEVETLRRKNDNLEKLCRGMQAQGRGAAVPNGHRSGATPGATGAGQVSVGNNPKLSEQQQLQHGHLHSYSRQPQHHHHNHHHHTYQHHNTHLQAPLKTAGAEEGASGAGTVTESDYDFEEDDDEDDDEDEREGSQEDGEYEDEDTEDDDAIVQASAGAAAPISELQDGSQGILTSPSQSLNAVPEPLRPGNSVAPSGPRTSRVNAHKPVVKQQGGYDPRHANGLLQTR